MRVLIVDDSDVIRQGIRALLSLMNRIVIVGEAENGTQALEKFRADKPDAVILDLKIPEPNGFQVLRHIKQESPETAVIIFSMHSQPPYRKRCLEDGADYFLDKTCDYTKLNDALMEIAARA
jgi:DNA-binding NarL/FixJ family response regulator